MENPVPAPPPRRVVKAVGPRLRVVLWVVYGLVALLLPNSVFLAAITALEWRSGGTATYQDQFYLWMQLAHISLGLLLILPTLVFGFLHWRNTHDRRNRRAVAAGYAVMAFSLAVLASGVAVIPLAGTAKRVSYWIHVGTPLLALWTFWLHRLAGPKIRWKPVLGYVGALAGIVLGMVAWKVQDPRKWGQKGPAEGIKYFEPSLARTANGNFVSDQVLMNDSYCLKCHQDAYNGWFHSAHHTSSFNNPAYLAAVRETRETSMKNDGDMKGARFCAGCHDPVPFFSGKFDDPKYDDVNDPTAKAGITCTACHAITHVNGTRGNADYTVEEPIHYPFAFSDNPLLQWINNTLVKAKPAFHKKTFLKPLHKTAEFCSTCHKVHLPEQLNKYKWLRGQNHYDSFLLSGVSGHGTASFYYPEHSQENCNNCHMPAKASNDIAARDITKEGKRQIHDHYFPGANTAIAHWRNDAEGQAAQEKINAGIVRADIFALRAGGAIDGPLLGPIRPLAPKLEAGKEYLLETVVRTVKMGHHFTQGTVDSNEVWMDVTVSVNGKVIGRSGEIGADASVDKDAHFFNVYMLDRNGKRISRRNAQDIFTPLYNHQIAPGAAMVLHYALKLPEKLDGPVKIAVALKYRKFDAEFIEFMRRTLKGYWALPEGGRRLPETGNDLPIMTLATDEITLPVAGGVLPESKIPGWQRWNDYGIGLLLAGKHLQTFRDPNSRVGQLKQAEEAFKAVEKLGRFDGPLNLARVYFAEGRLDEATQALQRAAAAANPPAPTWTLNYLTGRVNRNQGRLDDAAKNFRESLGDRSAEALKRGFDFSRDYETRAELAETLFEMALQQRGAADRPERERLLKEARAEYLGVLAEDAEHLAAHWKMAMIEEMLGDAAAAKRHQDLHLKYKPDDGARNSAIETARRDNPAAARSSERIAIYPLKPPANPRPGVARHDQ